MPDGYGNDLPSWAIDTSPPYKDSEVKWMMAIHLRVEHGMSLSEISKRTGLPYRDVRERLGKKDD
jgi:hypothetical protein